VIVHTDLLQWQQGEAERVLANLGFQKDMRLYASIGQFHVYQNLDYDGSKAPIHISGLAEFGRQAEIPLLSSGNVSLEIRDSTKWNVPINNELKEDENLESLRWDVRFVDGQERYEVRLPLQNANFEDYDKLTVGVMPEGVGEPEQFAVALYTNQSSYLFSRYDLDANTWNQEVFDLRGAKIGQALDSRALNLENVTAIGLVVNKKYYASDDQYSFHIREIALVPESTPYSPTAFQHELFAAPSNADIQLLEKSANTFQVNVKSEKPTILSLSESYDSLWKASINGQEGIIDSIPSNYISNGFVLPPGEHEILIWYAPEGWLLYSGVVSIVTLAVLGFSVALYSRSREPNYGKKDTYLLHGKHVDLEIDSLWSSKSIFQILLNPRKNTLLVGSNYLLILALGFLIVLPYSTVMPVEEHLKNNMVIVFYYLFSTAISLKIMDYAIATIRNLATKRIGTAMSSSA
jgi:hypothetical protein